MGHKKVERIDPLTLALPKNGVDSHAHLDDEAFDADREAVIARARAVGITAIINIFLDPLTFESKKAMFKEQDDIFYVLGMHPCDGVRFGEDAFQALEKAFLQEPRLCALGEIGLDYHWNDCPRETQIALFTRQLDLAKALHKPVVIHCREADEECLAVLESHGFRDYPLLWHCFGGDTTLAKRIIHNGWHISIPGPVTYKTNGTLREALSVIPSERLLLETDCPYLAPHPWRGTRNEPAYTVFTVHALANAMNKAVEELWCQLGNNAKRFFGLEQKA
ncbi:MAG: TatD family hydrolase [Desulfovibrio sp.]|nr:TatD family hydrolase [Desulfovibrio sp.]